MKSYDQRTFHSMIKRGEHAYLDNASLISVDCSDQDLAGVNWSRVVAVDC